MSPDIDELIRSTMRRHADDAPTAVDLGAVRLRSQQITRRRRFEAVTAVITTLALLLGLGYAASRIRTEATPIQPSPTGGAWTAFFRFDQNATEKRFSRLVLHTAAGETEIASAQTGAAVVGWYGEGRRTLVYTEGTDGTSSQSALMSITLGEDGSVARAAAPLAVPGATGLTGIPYPLRTGFAVWRQTGSSAYQGELVTVDDGLTAAVTTALPEGRAILVTPTTVAMGMPEDTTITLLSLGNGTSTTVAGCSPMATSAVAPDGVHASVACGDGSVVLLNLSNRTSFRTAAIPGAARAPADSTDPSGAILSLWYDPVLALHASMTPGLFANYTDVRDYGWNGVGWDAEGTGVLTRVFPEGSSPLRLERLTKDGVDSYNAGRWIVERPHDVDLGATTGTIAVRPVVKPSPSASPSEQALPPAPTTRPWTAGLRTVIGAGQPEVAVEVTRPGQQVTPITTIDGAQAALAGWTGPDRRTLVWGTTQDYPGDQVLETATLDAAGRLVAGPARLTAPDDGADLTGRAVVLSDGRLVVWRYSLVDGRPKGTLYRFSADLTTATTQQLPVGDLVFVTPDRAGLQDTQQAPSTLTIVAADGTSASVEPDIGSCITGYRAGTSLTGDFVALSCGSDAVDIVPVAMAGGAGVQPLASLPDGSTVLATWFTDSDSLLASTRAGDGAVTTWAYRPGEAGGEGSWAQAATQGVAIARYVDGYAVELVAQPTTDAQVTGAWTTGTDPPLDYGIGTGLDSLVQRPSS